MPKNRWRGSNALVATLLVASAVLVAAPGAARAESGLINVHVQLGVGLPPIATPDNFVNGGGLSVAAKADYKLHPIVSAQLGYLFGYFGGGGGGIDQWVMAVVAGTKLRFLDDHKGPLFYLKPGGKKLAKGNPWGLAWVDVNVGWGYYADGSMLAVDVGGGYEFSVFEYLGVGPFLSFDFFHTFGDESDLVTMTLGVSFTTGFPADISGAKDADADGLTDEEEDKNGNGVVDENETDPAKDDTDEDGLGDGDEIKRGTKPLDPDTDGDGAFDGEEVEAKSDPLDATKSPAFVDEVEKPKPAEDPLVKGVALVGVKFKGITLDPGSKAALDDAAAKIKARTDITLWEIGSHVHLDASDLSADLEKLRVGTKLRADKLVAELVRRGVPATVLVAKGYGGDEPIDSATPDVNERVVLKKLK